MITHAADYLLLAICQPSAQHNVLLAQLVLCQPVLTLLVLAEWPQLLQLALLCRPHVLLLLLLHCCWLHDLHVAFAASTAPAMCKHPDMSREQLHRDSRATR
jgi:hypothetical protein